MSFLGELKRRRVFRVAGVYAAVAFVVWQAADIAFPALHLPGWMVTAVVALTIIGFPIAVVLAWAFDVTPDGVVRTDARETHAIVSRSTFRTQRIAAAAGIVVLSDGITEDVLVQDDPRVRRIRETVVAERERQRERARREGWL
jgi:hypothetical protein